MKSNTRPALDELIDRSPPADIATESQTIGAILLSKGKLLDEFPEVDASLFHDERHRLLLAGMAKLREDGAPVEVAQLHELLKGDERINGAASIAAIIDGCATPCQFATHVVRLRDMANRRRLLQMHVAGIQAVHSEAPTSRLIETANGVLQEISHESASLPSPQGASDLIAENPRLHEPIIEGLLRRQEVANIIAPPKVGKSWLA